MLLDIIIHNQSIPMRRLFDGVISSVGGGIDLFRPRVLLFSTASASSQQPNPGFEKINFYLTYKTSI